MFGYDPHRVYYMMLLVSSAIIVILSILLMGIHMPKSGPWTKLRRAQKYLSLSYFIMGLAGIGEIMFDESDNRLVMVVYTAFIMAFQGLLFTATFLVILQPQFLKTRRVVFHLCLILSVGAGLSFWTCYGGDRFAGLIMTTAVTVYLVQQCYYTWVFRKHFLTCLKQLEEYYDEDQNARLRWIKFGFFSSVAVGLLGIVSTFGNIWMYSLFIVAYTYYYSYMTIRFNNYRLWATALVPVVAEVKEEPVVEEETEVANFEEEEILSEDAIDSHKAETDSLFAERLQKWVDDKGYLDKDVSVDEITRILGTDRNYLRYYFRTYVHNDFRTWRVELRIEEAKRIMKEQPELSLTQVGEMVGFNHRSNFFNQFQKMTGCSLSAYKEQVSQEK